MGMLSIGGETVPTEELERMPVYSAAKGRKVAFSIKLQHWDITMDWNTSNMSICVTEPMSSVIGVKEPHTIFNIVQM